MEARQRPLCLPAFPLSSHGLLDLGMVLPGPSQLIQVLPGMGFTELGVSQAQQDDKIKDPLESLRLRQKESNGVSNKMRQS